jgi:hypothetical protein
MTTLTKKVGGVSVPMTTEEQAAIETEWAANDAEKTVNDANQALADEKQARDDEVADLKVTTVAGNEFDANETSQERMTRAVLVLDDLEETDWKLSDNTWIKASKEELKEALRLAGEAQTAIWLAA